MYLYKAVSLILIIQLPSTLTNKIPLVGFFHDENTETELAFRLTIDRVNLDKNILPNSVLIPKIEHVSLYDSFNTSKRICNLTEDEGIGAIFGPQSVQTAGIVNSISNVLEIPHLQIHWDTSTMPSAYMVDLFPDPKIFAQALYEVIEDMDWKTFAILYEHSDALVRLQEVMKNYNRKTPEGHVPFTVWQLSDADDNRPLLKEIHSISETHFIIDCSVDRILPILHQAKEVGLFGGYFSYILTSLDAHTLNFGELMFARSTNVTTLRLVDPQKHTVQAIVHDWVFEEERRGRKINLTPEALTTESALMHDAVVLYATAVHRLGQNVTVNRTNCNLMEDSWPFGFSLIKFLRILELDGLTGKAKFDSETGRRTFFTLEITELKKTGFRKIGSWDPEQGIVYTRTTHEMEREQYSAISNMTFNVVSRLGEPYLRLATGDNLQGNARYEGFSMDLIEEVSKILNFKYKFYLVEDKQYGSFDKHTRQWNGLIRELKERKADLGICDLTITFERRSAVDFSLPFMTLGISILFNKPTKQAPDLFSFRLPLSQSVWMCMATAYLSVSLVLFFLSRISPYEWQSSHPCNQESEELECNFSLLNCMWLATGSLMQQGSDILPMAISTRTVAGMWWFFVLIMISSYTASLAAFLTTAQMDVTIENVNDLAKQSKIKYGVMENGASSNFFRNSNETLYQKMWGVIESTRPSAFVKNNDEGVERVLKGKRGYAFFMESTSIEYQVEQHCELTQVGGLLDSKGYGIAMPFNFPYRTLISGAILKLQEDGTLQNLKSRWWKEKIGRTPCSEKPKENAKVPSAELEMSNVGGMFLVLIAGCAVAFFVSILEFLWNVRKIAVEEMISPKEALMLELKFALQCRSSIKPVRKIRSIESIPAAFSSASLMEQINADFK